MPPAAEKLEDDEGWYRLLRRRGLATMMGVTRPQVIVKGGDVMRASCLSTRCPAVVLIFALGITVIAAPSMVAARPAEGGQNARLHKLPGRMKGAVKCRICAGHRCTVVSVRGRCTKRRALAALGLRLKRDPKRRMPLNPPVLDDRSYDQLQEETRRRVPRHTPEWTDHNDSDPGMTILKVARRNPQSIRVRPVGPKRHMIPEVDDEVMLPFEHGDNK